METNLTRSGKFALAFLLVLALVTLPVQPVSSINCNADPNHCFTITLASPPSPSNGGTVTGGPVTLAVTLTNSSDGRYSLYNKTYFEVEGPGSSAFQPIGISPILSNPPNGLAQSPYSPPFSGSYQWRVKVDAKIGSNVTSQTWSFTTSLTITTLVQSTTSTNTQTVGIITQYSYWYYTLFSYITAYTTQTISWTSTTQLTAVTTTTGYATTQISSTTTHQTVYTTQTRASYGTITITRYVYVESYLYSTELESVTIPGISSGSSGIAAFSKSDEHGIQGISIDVKRNVGNVTLAIRGTSIKGSGPADTRNYKSFEITATDLKDQDLNSVKIRFKVDKNWLASNHVQENAVSLYRNTDGSWNKLPTVLANDDTTYAYYEATSPGLSVYAIAAQASLSLQLPWFTVDLSVFAFLVNSYLFLVLLAGIVTLASITAIALWRKKHRKQKEDSDYPSEIAAGQLDEKVLDYVTSHRGAISMGQASEDLGVSAEDLTGTIEKLKADGRLRAS